MVMIYRRQKICLMKNPTVEKSHMTILRKGRTIVTTVVTYYQFSKSESSIEVFLMFAITVEGGPRK